MTHLTRKNLIITLAILVTAACATLLIQMKTANADIERYNVWDGRTEPANCYVEYTDPARTVCVSESYICKIQGGTISCQIKR